MTKEQKIAKLHQKIRTAQLDLMTLESDPVMTKEEVEKTNMAFGGLVVVTLAIAFVFVLLF